MMKWKAIQKAVKSIEGKRPKSDHAVRNAVSRIDNVGAKKSMAITKYGNCGRRYGEDGGKYMLTPKHSFSFPETSLPSLAHTYLPAWKTKLDELKRLCEQGRAKVRAAQRVPTIFDTSYETAATSRRPTRRQATGRGR